MQCKYRSGEGCAKLYQQREKLEDFQGQKGVSCPKQCCNFVLGCCKEYSHVSPGLEGCRTAVNHLPSCFCCLCAAFSSTKSVCSNVENTVEHSLLITELSVFGVNSSLIRQIVAFYKQLSSLGFHLCNVLNLMAICRFNKTFVLFIDYILLDLCLQFLCIQLVNLGIYIICGMTSLVKVCPLTTQPRQFFFYSNSFYFVQIFRVFFFFCVVWPAVRFILRNNLYVMLKK